MNSLLGEFPNLEIGGKKNKERINCESFVTLVAILWLETDPLVKTYFQPKVDVPVRYSSADYKFAIDLSVEFKNGHVWWIAFVDNETEHLFKLHPELVVLVQKSCKSSRARYIAMRVSPTDGFSLDVVVGL